MTTCFINPGAWDVPEATLRNAWKTVRAVRRELKGRAIIVRGKRADDDRHGRYSFDLVTPDFRRRACLQVPGLPPEQVAWPPQGEHWPPRFYVDGDSWQWPWAVEMVNDKLWGPR